MGNMNTFVANITVGWNMAFTKCFLTYATWLWAIHYVFSEVSFGKSEISADGS